MKPFFTVPPARSHRLRFFAIDAASADEVRQLVRRVHPLHSEVSAGLSEDALLSYVAAPDFMRGEALLTLIPLDARCLTKTARVLARHLLRVGRPQRKQRATA